MWKQWKIFEKMTKDLNHVLIWGPKWLVNWASEADIQHTSKRYSNWHVNQDWCETSGNFLRKWTKTGIFTYSGAHRGPNIGPLRPVLSTHLKVLAMSTWSNTDVKPVKPFWENDQKPEFWIILRPEMAPILDLWGPCSTYYWKYLSMWSDTDAKPVKTFEKVTKVQNLHLLCGPKRPKNLAFEAHIVQISAMSSNEHIKQDWYESRGANL